MVPLTKLAGEALTCSRGTGLKEPPCASNHLPPWLQGKDRKNPLYRNFHTALCSPHLAMGPVSHRAEEHGEVKVKASSSTASRRPGPACFKALSCQMPLLCRLEWGQGTRSESDCGKSAGVGGRWCGGKGWGSSRQEDGDGSPLLGSFLGSDWGAYQVLKGPQGTTKGLSTNSEGGFKFQTASNYPRDWGLHVTLVSSFCNRLYRGDLLPLEEWEKNELSDATGLGIQCC